MKPSPIPVLNDAGPALAIGVLDQFLNQSELSAADVAEVRAQASAIAVYEKVRWPCQP